MQGSLRVAVAPPPAACVAVLSALGAAGECSHGRARRRAAHSSVCRPSIPTLQSSLSTACSYTFSVCKCVHPAYTTTCPCVPGEWPRVISLLDDFNDWEVRRCDESRHDMHRVQVGGRTYVNSVTHGVGINSCNAPHAQVWQNASVLNAAVTALLRNGRKKEAVGLFGRISSAEIKAGRTTVVVAVCTRG